MNSILKPDLRKIFALAYLFITVFNPIGSTCQNRHFLTFYGTNEGTVGHAFVSFVREDNNLQQTVVDGIWGLYPASRTKGGASYLIGEVPGEIKDDFLTRPDVGLTVEVTPQEYKNALDIKNKWSNANYRLTEKDCLSFVIEVATSLSHKISIPGRCLFDFPSDYIIKLKELNENKGFNFASNGLIPSELCDYQRLLDGASNPQECQLRRELYTKLLGIATELGTYRRLYIQNGDLINVFPTVYYHMTVIEMDNIRKGEIKYSIDKMRQMIYFFDAYEYNRGQSESGREEHWKRHFEEVSNAKSYDFCQSFRKVMTSAIRAHVRFDLARAIRYAYDFGRSNSEISALKREFEATNSIFGLAQDRALDDICAVTSCSYLGNLNFRIFGGITINEITTWRMEAFDKALVNRVPLVGYNGNLAPQPSYFPHKIYYNLGEVACKGKTPECKSFTPSLFLFDLSGSMAELGTSNKAKIEEAKSAALTTIQSMKNNPTSGINQEVGILAFSGGCVTDPTTPVTNGFLADLDEVERSINAINFPGGGTPLAEAIEASEQKLQQHMDTSGAQQAKLIILSDGQATCNPIRPNDVYAFGQSGQVTRQYGASPQASGVPKIKYYTVGFNIAPGSPAERDLQYLAKISGGKYLNAQNQFELTRAFQKFNRIYVPKSAPALENIPNKSLDIFDEGINSIYTEIYPDALEKYKEYVGLHQLDCHGVYNLALMYEANEYYKSAMNSYESYLQLCPQANDALEVRKQIELLEQDYQAYLKFNRQVIESDMNYLELHFKKIQNGESIALATEFIAFIREKWNYYENLAALLEIEDKIFDVNAKAVFRGLKGCADTIRRNPQNWDRDAAPLLSRTFLNMERLLQSF